MSFELSVLGLGLAALFAGFVDAIVGGGGLIQIPALFATYPSASPAVLFGTNKIASIVGTSSAAVQYARKVRIPWALALPGALAALVGSWFGARAVVLMDPAVLRPLILLLLVAVAIYTFLRKDLGSSSAPAETGRKEQLIIVSIGAGIGFYDGFFGPGTGSFLIFLFVRFLRMDFLHASVTAKILNVATNIAAISYFASTVDLFWKLGILMAACNLAGAVIGSRLAIRRGVRFVRHMFLAVVSLLVLRLASDLFLG